MRGISEGKMRVLLFIFCTVRISASGLPFKFKKIHEKYEFLFERYRQEEGLVFSPEEYMKNFKQFTHNYARILDPTLFQRPSVPPWTHGPMVLSDLDWWPSQTLDYEAEEFLHFSTRGWFRKGRRTPQVHKNAVSAPL